MGLQNWENSFVRVYGEMDTRTARLTGTNFLERNLACGPTIITSDSWISGLEKHDRRSLLYRDVHCHSITLINEKMNTS